MPYTIAEQGPILRIAFNGTLTNHDLDEIGREADVIEARYEVIPHRVTDVRHITGVELDFEGVYRLATRRRGLHFQNRFKSAIIAVDLVVYGFARMFQTLNSHPQIVIALFPDDVQALAWLAQPGFELPSQAWVPPTLSV
jgi:hypothetical protein